MYGVLVWPPERLARFMEELQASHGVKGFGPPHLNLRQPFDWPYEEEALKIALKGILRGHPPFRLRLGGWGYFPQGVVYLRAYGGTPFRRLFHALEPLAPPLKEIEGPSYLPHLTLALGLGEAEAADLAQRLPPPPQRSFWVREVALVKDREEEDLLEVARFPLASLGR
ncbi:Phosphoesterase HXTX [Thermus sp. CCB_US3_UF1]|uniref:2'-5' RNA ligase family protein n=1 Tax=unclassified Thermus TaxID=2619321 RepID=UPI0002389796|nr:MULTISPECIES: 2'-5' RNA ligase family protein [unclassified Thermus]AEV15844.1 Phosphoesterase HXTX [Thermus sp. CCB_US3_UF1]MCS6867422.1 2'-5' RNA ligase family protein [Thermus sp.]MCX7850318.1 2'-5' RNA ligase family protein [Thermus sp.]MDW8357237.1 2'-5' RNA ligase family protein [Thermus sp.]